MRNSISKLAVISFLGGLIGRGLRYGFNIVIARGLGLDALGIFAFGMVVMKGCGVLARVGLDNAVQKYIPIYQSNNDPARVSGTVILTLVVPLLVGTGIALALYLGRGIIAAFTGVKLSSATHLFLLGIPLVAVMMVGVNATNGLKRTRYSVYSRDFGQSSTALVLMAVAAFVFSDLDLLIIGYLASIVVGAALGIIFLIREGALRFDVRPIFEYKQIFAFSLPLTLAASIQYLISWTDILVLGVFVPPEPIGWYQAAYQTSVLLVVVLQSANSIFPTVAAELYESEQRDRLARVYAGVTKWVTYLTVLGLAFVLIYNMQILSIFGTSVHSARTALVILAVGQTIGAIVGPTGFLLMMTGYERLQLMNNTVAAVLNLLLNVVLIQWYGIIGAAAATAFSLAILNLLRLVEVWYLLGLQPYTRQYWKGATAIAGAVLVLLLGKSLPVIGILRMFISGSMALLFFAVLIRLAGLDETDKILIESVDRAR